MSVSFIFNASLIVLAPLSPILFPVHLNIGFTFFYFFSMLLLILLPKIFSESSELLIINASLIIIAPSAPMLFTVHLIYLIFYHFFFLFDPYYFFLFFLSHLRYNSVNVLLFFNPSLIIVAPVSLILLPVHNNIFLPFTFFLYLVSVTS